MKWPPDKRRAPLAGGAPLENIATGNSDNPEHGPRVPKRQAFLRRRSGFARAAVFEEFGYRQGRAIDYGGFVDRKPNQRPRLWRAS